MDNLNDFDDLTFSRGRFAADAGVHARFYTLAVQNEEESAKAGRPIYADKEFVEIIAAGNANNIIKRKATEEDKQRFHRQYEIFCRDKEASGDQLVGTPLTEISWLTRSQVAEFAYMHIHTLEQLAHLDDNTCSRRAGVADIRRKAKAHLEASDKAAPMTEMAQQIETQKAQMQELMNIIETMKKAAK